MGILSSLLNLRYSTFPLAYIKMLSALKNSVDKNLFIVEIDSDVLAVFGDHDVYTCGIVGLVVLLVEVGMDLLEVLV